MNGLCECEPSIRLGVVSGTPLISNTSHSIFLTGVTGAAGGWLAAEALRRGLRVAALVRGGSSRHAWGRVEHSLAAAGVDAALARTVELIPGDLCADGPQWDALAGRLRGVGLIVHCAARVEFSETPDGLLRRTNVEGTRRILALASRLRAPLVHVSTAYVAGRLAGVSAEDELPPAPAFNNPYEQAKHEAEAMVRRWAASTGLPAIILRPSILLGDSARGVTIRFNTVYDFMQAFERIAPALGRCAIRVEAEPRATKNIIPLDYFGRAAWRIIERGEPGCYHLTHPEPLPMAALRDIFARLFGVGRIELVKPEAFHHAPPTRPERLYQRAIEAYQPYLRQEPVFDRRRAQAALAGSGLESPPRLDLAYFERLLAHARAVNWGADDAHCGMRNVHHAPPEGEGSKLVRANARTGVERYFLEFLTGKIGQQLLPDLRKISTTVGIRLEDSPGEPPWVLEIREGALRSVAREGADPQCAYRLNTQTFGQIVSGRLEPQKAFFQRLVDLEGDMEMGLRLAFILATFFRQYAWDLGEAPHGPAY